MSFDFITSALEVRRSEQLFRTRNVVDSASGPLIEVNGQHYINFSSNDYLAMRRSGVVAQAWVDGISEYGGGSGASPLVTGYTNAHKALEEYLANELKREKVLLFNSGFAANQAICQGLFSHNMNKTKGRIVTDRLMHSSFIDGALAANAKLSRFRHNDLAHLASLLNTEQYNAEVDTLVATESVFSMDGDHAPVKDILALSQKADAWLMVDDAHGFGVLGKKGLGVAESQSLSQRQLPILMATFGKAIGTAGAFVAGSADFIDYLINFARHYIYSTSMPAAQAYATLDCLRSSERLERKELLNQRIQQFKSLAKSAGLTLMPSGSPIQPVVIGCPDLAIQISDELKALGLWVTAIRYPTVPKNTDRLRITITAAHDERDIQALVDGLEIALSSKPLAS